MNHLFKALNDSTRRAILELLKESDLTAGDIAAHFDISKPSISHHLDLLKRANLVTSVRKGQYLLYSLNMSVFEEVIQWLMQFRDSNKED
jgi:DNA-binding transcriptional ArsR family regulator